MDNSGLINWDGKPELFSKTIDQLNKDLCLCGTGWTIFSPIITDEFSLTSQKLAFELENWLGTKPTPEKMRRIFYQFDLGQNLYFSLQNTNKAEYFTTLAGLLLKKSLAKVITRLRYTPNS